MAAHAAEAGGARGPARRREAREQEAREQEAREREQGLAQGRWPALDEDGLPVAGTATAALIPVMTRICGVAGVVSDPRDLRTYECDGLTSHRTAPGLVVLPETAEQVAEVVRACAGADVPFVARGSGTGLSGGALPRSDGVLIVTSRMRQILEVDPLSRVPSWSRVSRTFRSARPSSTWGSSTLRTRPARWSARSAATSRKTPAARTA